MSETNEQRYLRLCWEHDPAFRLCLWTLAHNLSIAGFGALMWRSGDNHGFHMGADESQCTCQWSPGRGEPYRPSSRCEQEDDYDEPDVELDDLDEYDPPTAIGPNGCTCGFNGDCNCRFIP